MPHFDIDYYQRVHFYDDEKNRHFNSLKLDDEWDIVCIRGPWIHYSKSIYIRRKNNVGDFSVSGELTFTYDDQQVWSKHLSHVMEDGVLFLDLGYFPMILISQNGHRGFEGFVDITEISSENCATELENEGSNLHKSMEELTKDMARLTDPNSSCFTDVVLKCEGVTIPANKNILSVRSPVFAAMFDNPMKESLKNEVDVTDMDIVTLRALLVHMYTGSTCDVTASSAASLLFAADKYQLEDLKSVCSDVLKENVTLQNVLRIFVLGEMHSQDLKSFALDYICCKRAEFTVIEETEEWENMRKEKPSLVIDILTSLVKSSNRKIKEIKSEKKVDYEQHL